jgi:glutamate/tyrosine decarboxylase-like PLP-dependent enzyme
MTRYAAALGAIRNSLVRQAQQRIAAPAHLDGDFAQGGTLETEAGRLAVDRAAQVADLLRGAFPEIL